MSQMLQRLSCLFAIIILFYLFTDSPFLLLFICRLHMLVLHYSFFYLTAKLSIMLGAVFAFTRN